MKSGDIVTLGANPTIKMGATMVFFKPHASVTRTLGSDVEADLAALKKDLHTELFRALQAEVDFTNSVYAALGETNSIEELKALCKKELGNAEVTYETVAKGASKAGKISLKPKPKL